MRWRPEDAGPRAQAVAGEGCAVVAVLRRRWAAVGVPVSTSGSGGNSLGGRVGQRETGGGVSIAS